MIKMFLSSTVGRVCFLLPVCHQECLGQHAFVSNSHYILVTSLILRPIACPMSTLLELLLLVVWPVKKKLNFNHIKLSVKGTIVKNTQIISVWMDF